MSPRFFALMPGGYPNVKDDYAACDSMEEAKAILEEARIFMGAPALHVFDGGREPWSEHDPYPDFNLEPDSDGVIRAERC